MKTDTAKTAWPIPPLHVAERWDTLEAARLGMLSDIRQANAAERYCRKA